MTLEAPMNEAQFRDFGQEWIQAWNSHDLDRIVGHYGEDVVLTSEFIQKLIGPGIAEIRGIVSLRNYFRIGLENFPSLKFELFAVYPGANSVVLHYRSVNGLLAAEFMRFNANGKVSEVCAHYRQESALSPT